MIYRSVRLKMIICVKENPVPSLRLNLNTQRFITILPVCRIATGYGKYTKGASRVSLNGVLRHFDINVGKLVCLQ